MEEVMRLTNRNAPSQFVDYKYEIYVEHFVLFHSKVKNYTKFQTRMCEIWQKKKLIRRKLIRKFKNYFSLLVNTLKKMSNSFESLVAIVSNSDEEKTSHDHTSSPVEYSMLSHTYVTETNGSQVTFNDSCSIYNHFRVCQNDGVCKLNENSEPSCL